MASSLEPHRPDAGGGSPLHHSYLYAPGNQPNVIRKAVTAGADCVVFDLEDAVLPDEKATARKTVASLLADLAERPSVTGPDIHVRINVAADGYDFDDLAAVVGPAVTGVRLPKAEDSRRVASVASWLDDLEARAGIPHATTGIYPLIESAMGMHHALALLAASPRVVRAALGTTDLLADLGIPGETREATLHVRSRLVIDSRVAGVGPPIDSVHTDLGDLDGLVAAARWARSLGFVGKSVIHPCQIEPTHEVFAPTDEEVAQAQEVLDHAGQGASRLGDRFIDAAVIARAKTVLRLQRKQ